MVFCGQCGARNPDSMRFCGQCGAKLTVTPSQLNQDTYPASRPISPQTDYGQTSRVSFPFLSGSKTKTVLIAVAIVAIVAIVAVFAVSSMDEDKHPFHGLSVGDSFSFSYDSKTASFVVISVSDTQYHMKQTSKSRTEEIDIDKKIINSILVPDKNDLKYTLSSLLSSGRVPSDYNYQGIDNLDTVFGLKKCERYVGYMYYDDGGSLTCNLWIDKSDGYLYKIVFEITYNSKTNINTFELSSLNIK